MQLQLGTAEQRQSLLSAVGNLKTCFELQPTRASMSAQEHNPMAEHACSKVTHTVMYAHQESTTLTSPVMLQVHPHQLFAAPDA